MPSQLRKQDLWSALPPVWPEDLLPAIRAGVSASRKKLVVLDDDPTGTQTVYDLPVLTQWSTEVLRAELANDLTCFYLLTNSRSLSREAAVTLNTEIAANLKAASAATGRSFSVVSRSDSTLRGHFPAETDALTEELGAFDGLLLVPFFEAGGRFTINDVHYVAEGESLVPAADTPFARDPAFGFRTSNLRDWAVEKSDGRLAAEEVTSISLEEIRRGGPEVVRNCLERLTSGRVCAVNAAAQRDLEVVVAAVSAAEANGRRFLFRTAASFVAVRLGLNPRPLLTGRAILGDDAIGGLTVVGSYVPKTTTQLEPLLADETKEVIELNVAVLLEPGGGADSVAVREASARVNQTLAAGRDAVVYTSRKLIGGGRSAESLVTGRKVSEALVELVRQLEVTPRYLIAKGGITSSDIATRGLGVRRAMVLGQVLPGVPVWRLGEETRFPGLAYVVFPGNVGGPEALAEATARFSASAH